MELAVKALMDGVAAIQRDFDSPDDDWGAICVLECERERVFVPLFFDNDDEKETIATRLIPMAMLRLKPWMVGTVISAWTVHTTDLDEIDVRPSEHPRRIEVVTLSAITLDQEQFWMARIRRFPDKPPELGKWRLQQGERSGLFVDPIVETFKFMEEHSDEEA